MSTAVEIRASGKRYGGWTAVRVRRSLEESAGQFEVAMSLVDPDTASPLDIGVEVPCEVWLGDSRVISGYVDRIAAAVGQEGTSCSVAGRSKPAQLADCSIADAQGAFKNQTQLQIARALVQPYGLTVETGTGATLSRRHGIWRAKANETVYAALERLTRDDNVLITDTASGAVLLTQVAQSGGVVETIEPGAPVLAIEAVADSSQTFSRYHCRGQSVGDDDTNGAAAASPSGFADDPDVSLYRPTVIDTASSTTPGACRERARTEAAIRAGRSVPVTMRLAGWTWSNGALVEPGQRVAIRWPSVRVDGAFVVVSVDYLKSHDEGTVCDLMLLPPQAFSVDEIVARPASRRRTAPGLLERTATKVAAAARVSAATRWVTELWK